MIGFGFCELIVKNEIVQGFLTLTSSLLTGDTMTENSSKHTQFFTDSLDRLLKIGLIFDTRAWKTVRNEMFGQISMKIL